MSHATDYDEDLDGPRIVVTDMDSNKEETMINPTPRRGFASKKQSSFAAVVADLGIGESASRTHHLNQDMTLAELQRDLSEMKSMIDNNVRPAVVSAKKLTGGEYRIETTTSITTAGRVYLLAIVTRTS